MANVPLSIVFSMVQLTLILLGSRELGRILLRDRKRLPNASLRFALEASLGCLVLTHILFLLVVCNLVTEPGLWTVMGVLTLLAGIGSKAWRLKRSGISIPAFGAQWWLVAGASLYVVSAAFFASLPATSIDELVYHLEVPKSILEHGGLPPFRDNVYAYFPQLGEMLFLLGLGTTGEAAARLLQLIPTLLIAVTIFGFSRSRGVSKTHSLFASVAFLTVPSVMSLASIAYVDLYFCLYAFLGLILLIEYLKAPSLSIGLLLGIVLGGCWSSKYTGLQWVLLILLLALLEHLWSRRNVIPWVALTTPALALLVVSPYLIRNWVQTGWPLFPFRVLGRLDPQMNWDSERADLFLRWLSGFGGVDHGLWSTILSPLLVFVEARFGDLTRYDGFLGPLFLAVPLLLLGKKPGRETLLLAIFGLGFSYYWAITTPQVRFLLPVIPVLCCLLAFGLDLNRASWVRLVVALLIGLNLLVGISHLGTRASLGYWFGIETRDEYLTRMVVGYPLYKITNEVLTTGDLVYLVNMRNFGYFLKRPYRADYVFEYYRLANVLKRAGNPGEIYDFFSSQGVSYLMIDEEITLSDQALDTAEQRKLANFLMQKAELVERNPLRPVQSLWKLKKLN